MLQWCQRCSYVERVTGVKKISSDVFVCFVGIFSSGARLGQIQPFLRDKVSAAWSSPHLHLMARSRMHCPRRVHDVSYWAVGCLRAWHVLNTNTTLRFTVYFCVQQTWLGDIPGYQIQSGIGSRSNQYIGLAGLRRSGPLQKLVWWPYVRVVQNWQCDWSSVCKSKRALCFTLCHPNAETPCNRTDCDSPELAMSIVKLSEIFFKSV